MKKNLGIRSLSFISLLVFGGLSGCVTKGDTSNTLTIVCLNKGYGREWIDDLVSKWNQVHEGYQISLSADAQAPTLITKHMASKNNPDDLYISVGESWLTYAGQGMFAPLDDLLKEKVDGKTIEERVNDEFQISLKQTQNGETHCYHLPWTRGIGGIYYNRALLDKVPGWKGKVPETTDELIQLTADIKNAELVNGKELVKPFVYTGANTDYFDYTVLTWWAQLVGTDAIKDFLTYSSPSVFDASIPTNAYASLKKATEVWYSLFGDPSNYVDNSASKSNDDAQQDFLNGKAVMMMDCDWIYNEMLSYDTKNHALPSSMDLRMMKTPIINGAKDPSAYYVVGDDQYIAIPASSKKKDLAKSFIQLMVSDEGCRTFFEKAHGFLAYDFEPEIKDDSYLSSVTEVRKGMGDCITKYSTSPLYLNGPVDIWGTSALRPFQKLLYGNTSVEAQFEIIKQETARNWDSWKASYGA